MNELYTHPCIKYLLIYLPIEIVHMIAYKYQAMMDPNIKKCFSVCERNLIKYTLDKSKYFPDDESVIYRLWYWRKQNFYDNDNKKELFLCAQKNISHGWNVINKYSTICHNKNIPTNNKQKYGLLHYMDNKFTFPLYCPRETLIDEILKNKLNKSLKDFNNYSNKELINIYFKIEN